MSAFDWSTNAGLNAIADKALPVPDGVSARVYASLVRGLMAGVAQFIADTSGALVSVGLGDLYAVNTFSGLKPKPGTMIAFWAHRTNEAEPSLMVDGYGPVAFLAADGNELAPGAVVQGQLQMVVWDEAVSPEKPAWRKINPAATDLQVLNAQTALEALAGYLPKEAPDGAGKLWYSNGSFQVTTGGAVVSVFDWSTRPAANAVSDAGVPALDGASARELPGLVRDLMAAVAGYVGDQGGAIRTGGVFNAYVARTASGVRAPRPGVAVLVQVDRDNTDDPTLNVDGAGARPWLDMDGTAPPAGAMRAGAFYLAIASGPGWVSDFGGLARSDAEDAAITAALVFGGI